MTLPPPLRNRLATLIVDAVDDAEARQGLEALAAVCADPRALDRAPGLPARFPADLFERADGLRVKAAWARHAGELRERTAGAWRALRGRPLGRLDAPLEAALAGAAPLFEAGLYFEVHELLERRWMRAAGPDREALQGLIQIAAGFQHQANGNLHGARRLLRQGAMRTRGRHLAGVDLDPFARAVERSLEQVTGFGDAAAHAFDRDAVPTFPRRRCR